MCDVMVKMLRACEKMSSCVVHSDLKPANILLLKHGDATSGIEYEVKVS